jgi:MFS family permease
MTVSEESEEVESRDYPSSIWRNQNFVSLITGRLVTNAGDSLYTIAALWLVFELSGSTFLTGVANSLLLLPFLLQIIAGPIVDRLPLKRVLVGSQFIQGVVILILPLAAYMGNLTVELILITIPILALVGQIVSPTQTAVLPRLVDDDQLSQCNSVLATVTLGLDMVFQAFGGLLIAMYGATILFLLDSATFMVAGLLFMAIVVPPLDDETEESEEIEEQESEESVIAGYVDDMREGVEILRGTVFMDMMFTSAVFNFAVGVTLAILPAFGDLNGGPAVYGFLLGALGTGRMVGSLSASYLEDMAYGRLKSVTYLASALLWVGAVYSSSVVLTVGLFGLAWVSAGVSSVLVETLNQRVIPGDLLGRVSAIKGTASTATLPVGSLIGGYVAELIGVTTTMGLAAFGFGFAGLYFVSRPSLRRLPAVKDADPVDFNIKHPSETSN